MNYEETISYIHSAPKISKILGNDALRKVLSILNNPQDKLKFVHIAGTNGKGSTAAMINSALYKSKIKTGLFTSPYLEVFNERIRINNEMISDDKLCFYTEKVKYTMEKHNVFLSEFALILVIALLYYADEKCEIVVLETGLGGRLDATNVISDKLVAVITKISRDHMQYLGNTESEIAFEKCGIIKPDTTVVSYPEQSVESLEIIEKTCLTMNAELIIPQKPNVKKDYMLFENQKYTLSLKGFYQYSNAVVAIKTLEVLIKKGFNISSSDIKYGMSHTLWPGRFEYIKNNLILDGCHNEDGARALADTLKSEHREITLVTCVMEDKDYQKLAEIFSGITDKIIITTLNSERTLSMEKYAECYLKNGVTPIIEYDVSNAIKKGMSESGICVVCGSLYLVGEVRRLLKNKETAEGR